MIWPLKKENSITANIRNLKPSQLVLFHSHRLHFLLASWYLKGSRTYRASAFHNSIPLLSPWGRFHVKSFTRCNFSLITSKLTSFVPVCPSLSLVVHIFVVVVIKILKFTLIYIWNVPELVYPFIYNLYLYGIWRGNYVYIYIVYVANVDSLNSVNVQYWFDSSRFVLAMWNN